VCQQPPAQPCSLTCKNGGQANAACQACACPQGWTDQVCSTPYQNLIVTEGYYYSVITSSQWTQKQFASLFSADIAYTLNIATNQVVVTGYGAESDPTIVDVDFQLRGTPGQGPSDVAALISALNTDLSESAQGATSQLATGLAGDDIKGASVAVSSNQLDGTSDTPNLGGGGGAASSKTPIIVGVVVGVAVLLALLIVAVVITRRRQAKLERDVMFVADHTMMTPNPAAPTVYASNSYVAQQYAAQPQYRA